MDYSQKAKKLRGIILKMHNAAQTSHIGSAFSCLDILVALYYGILKIKAANPQYINRDRFILSKGHAITALYAVLADKKFIPKETLEKYCCDGGLLPGHATRGTVPGVEFSTGSLGHGLPVGSGMALAGKIDKLKYRVFVLLSDGECNEGSVWEAVMFSAHHKLDNLIAIVDYNKIQGYGRTSEIIDMEPLKDKWLSFGWNVKEVDGHDHHKIIRVLNKIPVQKGKPTVIIAHTVKGKGVSFMENTVDWHYKSTNPDQFKRAFEELKLS